MNPIFSKVHKGFKLNGRHYDFDSLKEAAQSFVKEDELYKVEIGTFLLDWLDDNDFILAKTSGSTGQPKIIKLSKQAMVNSTIATGDFFKLEPTNTALLCLPATYIAGKMMLVRAIVLGLELDSVKPTTNPDFKVEKHYDFCAMIPAQAENTLVKLDNINALIVGGAQVSFQLKEQLKGLKTNVFETYGMTETITHIAVKRINNPSLRGGTTKQSLDLFVTLPNIIISQNENDCLVIEAPKLTPHKIETNDIVKIHSKTTFEWLGRIDNVINSGGVKLFPEQIEAKLESRIKSRFFIASKADKTFGEKVILILEAETNTLNTTVFSGLTSIETPKKVYSISNFIETSSGKINRKKTLALLKK